MDLAGQEKITRIHVVCILLIACTVAAISVMTWVPPVSRDALTHHLALPKLYLQHGGIYEIPHLGFSYYPMNLDLLYLVPLYFGNDILPKFIHFAFALATAGLICRYLARRINLAYGLLGALFFLTIPVIVHLCTTVYVDLGLIFFLFASLLCLFSWIESGFRPWYLIGSSVLCGLALGTKYNGLVGLFLLGLFSAFVYARYNAGQRQANLKSFAWGTLFVLIALTVFSPWMIRNYAWTSNPVYPLYNSIFDSQTAAGQNLSEGEEKESVRITHIQYRRYVYGESWLEIALIPVRVFFQGEDDNPRYFDGKTSPFLLLLPIFAFFGIWSESRQVKTEKFMMLFFSVLFLLYACVHTSIRIRYFSPILPPLAVLSMFGLHRLQALLSFRAGRIAIKNVVVFCIIFAMLGMNAAYMAGLFTEIRPLSYISGQVPRDQYIQSYRPEYASYQYANRHLTQKDKILALYLGNRGYYSDVPVEFTNDLLEYTEPREVSAGQVAANLHKKGFTHLLVNFSMFSHLVREQRIHKKEISKAFFKNYTVKMFAKDGYGLLRIKNTSRSGIIPHDSKGGRSH